MSKPFMHLGELSLLQPTVHFIRITRSKPGQSWGPRTISDCHLIYMLSGEATAVVGDQKWRLQPEQCLFYGTDSVSEIVASESDPAAFYSLHFDWNAPTPAPMSEPQLLAGIRKSMHNDLGSPALTYQVHVPPHGLITIPHYFRFPGAEPILELIKREFDAQEPGFELALRGLMGRLIAVWVRLQIMHSELNEENKKIAPALKAVEQQPEADWTIGALAELCGYHPHYFAEIFKEAVGMTPKAYLIGLRMKRAKLVLLEEETIEQAAFRMGYRSLHYFCRHFKEETGLTPSEFKKQFRDL